ncbi:hypothetical protein [Streptomyces sp. UG1]|uniref:hypothetical protein n=1 Tax=Streptomyces sp. UG1 TaxID=3417652 RepID=UPI003CE9C390
MPKGNWRIDTHAHYFPDVYYDYLERHGGLADTLPSARSTTAASPPARSTTTPTTSCAPVVTGSGSSRSPRCRTARARWPRWTARSVSWTSTASVCSPITRARYLGDPSFAPLYEVLDHHGGYVYVHPTGPEVNPAPKLRYGPDIPALNFVYEYTFDATRAMTSLIYNGVLFGSDWPPVHNLFEADNLEKMPFLEGRLPDPRAGDPEPPVDGVYSPRQRIALERTNALAQFPKLRARIPRLSRH